MSTTPSNQTLVGFDTAIDAIKGGRRAKRVGWNGKDQYIEIATNISFKRPDGSVYNPNHEDIGNNAIAFHGTRGCQIGWLASQADMLASDWIVY